MNEYLNSFLIKIFCFQVKMWKQNMWVYICSKTVAAFYVVTSDVFNALVNLLCLDSAEQLSQ